MTREIKDESSRACALRELASSTSQSELLPEALSVTREIKSESYRASALSRAGRAPARVIAEALSVTREIKS